MQTNRSPNDSDVMRAAREVDLPTGNGSLADVFIDRVLALVLADCDPSMGGRHSMKNDRQRLGFLAVLGSVLASFIGVQKDEIRQRDFSKGRARDFILVGVLLTATFVLVVWGVVQLVMRVAAPT